MKKNGRSRFLAGALVIVAIVCSLWTSQASAYPTFQFSGTAAVVSTYADPALNFDVYDVNYFISISQTAATQYSAAGSGTPAMLTNMAGTMTLSGGLNFSDDSPSTLNFLGTFVNPLYVAYDPALLTLSFGPDDGTGTTSDFFSIYDFGLPADYDLRSNFGPFSTVNFFQVPDFAADFIELKNNISIPVNLEVSINDTTATAVPEPSTFLLIGGGLAGLAFWRRRRA